MLDDRNGAVSPIGLRELQRRVEGLVHDAQRLGTDGDARPREGAVEDCRAVPRLAEDIRERHPDIPKRDPRRQAGTMPDRIERRAERDSARRARNDNERDRLTGFVLDPAGDGEQLRPLAVPAVAVGREGFVTVDHPAVAVTTGGGPNPRALLVEVGRPASLAEGQGRHGRSAGREERREELRPLLVGARDSDRIETQAGREQAAGDADIAGRQLLAGHDHVEKGGHRAAVARSDHAAQEAGADEFRIHGTRCEQPLFRSVEACDQTLHPAEVLPGERSGFCTCSDLVWRQGEVNDHGQSSVSVSSATRSMAARRLASTRRAKMSGRL